MLFMLKLELALTHVQDEIDGVSETCRMRWMVYQTHVQDEMDGVSGTCAG